MDRIAGAFVAAGAALVVAFGVWHATQGSGGRTPAAVNVYLSDADVRGPFVRTGAAGLNGETFGHAVIDDCTGGGFVARVPAGARRLTGRVAVDDGTVSVALGLRITVDGSDDADATVRSDTFRRHLGDVAVTQGPFPVPATIPIDGSRAIRVEVRSAVNCRPDGHDHFGGEYAWMGARFTS